MQDVVVVRERRYYAREVGRLASGYTRRRYLAAAAGVSPTARKEGASFSRGKGRNDRTINEPSWKENDGARRDR